ncbi:hypothetical protein [Cobetia sp. 29-18-1]|uniref:hypothetical protein n=1 Tax=Cobetia sp. 29-18-1 TaxID=3040018 RepID=UPI00244A02C0|nr:hypothetical protein [Cobetia sp. 29-18-1]MDH2298730.1 hypothetical protein [Cobetia sp. 29-18-1]
MNKCKFFSRPCIQYLGKYIVPSLLSMGVALIIFWLGAYQTNLESVREYKVSRIDEYQVLVSGMNFDTRVKAQYVCSPLKKSNDTLNNLISETASYRSEIRSAYSDLMKEKMANEGITPEDLSAELAIINNDSVALGRLPRADYVDVFDGYREIYVKGKLASVAISNEKFDGIFGAVNKVNKDIAELDSRLGKR